MQVRINDRRQCNIPVENDRRSGMDRREIQQEHSSVFYALESVPTFRRLASLPEKIDNGDMLPAIGLAGLAAINFPEDMSDIKASVSQIRGLVDKSHVHKNPYNRRTHQHSFSFFRGTLIEEWLHKKIDNGNKFAKKLYEMDWNTLYETKFGKWVEKVFGIEQVDVQRVDAIKDIKGQKARSYQFKSEKLGGEITARAMKRIPLLSVIVLGVLEMPKIIKAGLNGENFVEGVQSTAKQSVKSAINTTSTLAGIGYGGAIGAKYLGATGSIVGMGLGAILGSKLSKKTQDVIG